MLEHVVACDEVVLPVPFNLLVDHVEDVGDDHEFAQLGVILLEAVIREIHTLDDPAPVGEALQ